MRASRREQVFTPEPFVDRVMSWIEPLLPDRPLRVLEPAAGGGALVDGILRLARRRGQAPRIDAWELDATLAASLAERAPPAVHVHAGDFLAAAPAPGEFDLVVSNPPWLRETGHAELFRRLRSTPAGREVYRRNADLHHFFWFPSIDALRDGGTLAMIVPAAVLESESAEPIRARLLAEGRVRYLWRAGAERVFPDVGVETAVVVWTKGGASAPSAGPVVPGRPEARPQLSARRFRVDTIPEPVDAAAAVPLAEVFRVVEGVSTGADRLRRADAERVEGGRPGEGILLLRDPELDALGLRPSSRERWVRRRAGRSDEWVLWVRDGEVPELDGRADPDEETDPALVRHLLRFRPVLARRAEIRRNASRSWYAVAWPRSAVGEQEGLWCAKWAHGPAFHRLRADALPTTDHRVLLLRTERWTVELPAIAEWLESPAMRTWFEQALKRKGEILEFYGAALGEAPIPRRLVRPREAPTTLGA